MTKVRPIEITDGERDPAKYSGRLKNFISVGMAVLCFGHETVDEVGCRGGYQHSDTHDEVHTSSCTCTRRSLTRSV